MAHVDPDLLEILLHRAEGDTLDFKREQYRYVGALDEQRGELLKDILAFANAWKTEDAYIVIGADENPGGRATITGVGVAGHLDDAELQRFVNSKTNVPIAFEYVPLAIGGEQIAIIRIRGEQQRPVFTAKPFGKVRAGVVYIRRSSHTAEATPDEVARIGAARAQRAVEPGLSVQFGERAHERRLGLSVSVLSRVLADPLEPPPSSEAALDVVLRRIAPQWGLGSEEARLREAQQVRAYRTQTALVSSLRVVVDNTGTVLAEDVRIEFDLGGSLTVLDRRPRRPFKGYGAFGPAVIRIPTAPAPITRWTEVQGLAQGGWRVSMRLGKVQPGATKWSAPFWLGASDPIELKTTFRVFGDNLPRALSIDASIAIGVEHGWLDDYEEHDEEEDEDGL